MQVIPAVGKQDAPGAIVVELLVVIAMITVITGFVLLKYFQGRNAATRTSTAVEFANYLQKARLDSMRRKVTDIEQMAQVKVFNGRYYSIAIDANSDGYLDIPLVMIFPAEQGLQIQGPFPKTFIFDRFGQTVDSTKRRVPSQPVILGDDSGGTAVKFSETGEVVVMPAIKLMAAR